MLVEQTAQILERCECLDECAASVAPEVLVLYCQVAARRESRDPPGLSGAERDGGCGRLEKNHTSLGVLSK